MAWVSPGTARAPRIPIVPLFQDKFYVLTACGSPSVSATQSLVLTAGDLPSKIDHDYRKLKATHSTPEQTIARFKDKPADTIDMSIPFAAGALFSTIEDLYRWDQALYTDQFASQELLELMLTPHAKIDSDESYGYGWIIGKMGDYQVISHGGGIDGFLSEIRRYSDDKVTIIVLSNRDTTDVGNVADQIAKVLFEE